MTIPAKFIERYEQQLAEIANNPALIIDRQLRYDVGHHPATYIDCECAFAAEQLARCPTVKTILDVGSYRHFILGLLAHYQVATVDVREREPATSNETVTTCDAKSLDTVATGRFDAVISLCALEHFGLGRYGDDVDLDAYKKALKEMVRVLRPDGILIFTTHVTRGATSLGFNAHWIFNYEALVGMCKGLGLTLHEERFIKHSEGQFCSLEEVVASSYPVWDVYCGCFQKIAT